jgi:hypothetical protein
MREGQPADVAMWHSVSEQSNNCQKHQQGHPFSREVEINLKLSAKGRDSCRRNPVGIKESAAVDLSADECSQTA